ncbi:MAG: hypothetical protein ABSF36_03450 [Candidatus Methanomethylicaceae archaeon]
MSEEAIGKMDTTSKALGMSRSEYIDLMIKKGFHFSDDVDQISKLQERIKEKIEEGSRSDEG